MAKKKSKPERREPMSGATELVIIATLLSGLVGGHAATSKRVVHCTPTTATTSQIR